MKKSDNHITLIILLALLSSVAPMGVDTYIPSIPDLAKYFDVKIEKVELSLSIFLIGLSIGQVFGGAISDYYGRKKSSIYGLLGFSFFSFLIIFSSSIYEVWIYRFLESFCGGIVLVNASAIVRDRFSGNEAAKVFSVIGTIRSIAPLIAPAIGAFIIHFFTWKAVFIFLTLYPFFIILFTYKNLEDTALKVNQSVISSFLSVFKNKDALKAMFTLGFSFSGLFIFIIKAPFIYIEYFKISTDYFPIFFSFNFFMLVLLTKVNLMFLKKYSPLDIMKIAILFQIFTSFLMLINGETITLIEVVIYLAIYVGLMAFIFGNALALAIQYFPNNAGVASGVAGVLQFGFASIVSFILLSNNSSNFLAIGLSIFILSLLSFLLCKTIKKV